MKGGHFLTIVACILAEPSNLIYTTKYNYYGHCIRNKSVLWSVYFSVIRHGHFDQTMTNRAVLLAVKTGALGWRWRLYRICQTNNIALIAKFVAKTIFACDCLLNSKHNAMWSFIDAYTNWPERDLTYNINRPSLALLAEFWKIQDEQNRSCFTGQSFGCVMPLTQLYKHAGTRY